MQLYKYLHNKPRNPKWNLLIPDKKEWDSIQDFYSWANSKHYGFNNQIAGPNGVNVMLTPDNYAIILINKNDKLTWQSSLEQTPSPAFVSKQD